jgi:hypothetical protein
MSENKGIKLIFETYEGERVERRIRSIWSSMAYDDLSVFHSMNAAEDMKTIVTKAIVEEVTEDLVAGMLDELIKETKIT